MVCDGSPWSLLSGCNTMFMGHPEKILACAYSLVGDTFCWIKSYSVCKCGDIYCISSNNAAYALNGGVAVSGASVAEYAFGLLPYANAWRVRRIYSHRFVFPNIGIHVDSCVVLRLHDRIFGGQA